MKTKPCAWMQKR